MNNSNLVNNNNIMRFINENRGNTDVDIQKYITPGRVNIDDSLKPFVRTGAIPATVKKNIIRNRDNIFSSTDDAFTDGFRTGLDFIKGSRQNIFLADNTSIPFSHEGDKYANIEMSSRLRNYIQNEEISRYKFEQSNVSNELHNKILNLEEKIKIKSAKEVEPEIISLPEVVIESVKPVVKKAWYDRNIRKTHPAISNYKIYKEDIDEKLDLKIRRINNTNTRNLVVQEYNKRVSMELPDIINYDLENIYKIIYPNNKFGEVIDNINKIEKDNLTWIKQYENRPIVKNKNSPNTKHIDTTKTELKNRKILQNIILAYNEFHKYNSQELIKEKVLTEEIAQKELIANKNFKKGKNPLSNKQKIDKMKEKVDIYKTRLALSQEDIIDHIENLKLNVNQMNEKELKQWFQNKKINLENTIVNTNNFDLYNIKKIRSEINKTPVGPLFLNDRIKSLLINIVDSDTVTDIRNK